MPRNLTLTLKTTPGVPMPAADPPFGTPAGFRITVTRPDGSKATPTIETKHVWTFTGLTEGAVYTFLAEVVDGQGRAIQSLAETSVTVPAAPTFERIDGLDFAWT